MQKSNIEKALAFFAKEGIEITSNNGGVHLYFIHKGVRYDFWPSSGLLKFKIGEEKHKIVVFETAMAYLEEEFRVAKFDEIFPIHLDCKIRASSKEEMVDILRALMLAVDNPQEDFKDLASWKGFKELSYSINLIPEEYRQNSNLVL